MTTKFYEKFTTNQSVKRHLFDVYSGSTPRLCKIRPLLEMFGKCCVETKNEEMQCVDEQIIPYKGKHKLKQYLPCKPHK
ncbi:hypothetical protein T12_671 [Trichinella patagoniensis]|uniref:PiggyBac transposable element-derived protein domain-containing protein n=1 Tax=Trichinella patagoniensis TaxID=990121 RepID=A0A0V0Z4K3_9BILA|nr:hypothetical protein T12_671 [Trichinella patagoniensis]